MHRFNGTYDFKSRINQVELSSDKLFLVLNNQARIGIIKYNKKNRWFIKMMKELKIELWICI